MNPDIRNRVTMIKLFAVGFSVALIGIGVFVGLSMLFGAGMDIEPGSVLTLAGFGGATLVGASWRERRRKRRTADRRD